MQPELRLSARLYLPPSEADPEWRAAETRSLPGLIVGHGAGSRAARHEAFCLEARRQGFAVLALDFRGHGDSEGSADGPLELDILAAAAYLRAHPAVDPTRICYRGSSMGGFYGLKAAAQAEADFAAIALLCPAAPADMLALLAAQPDSLVRDTEGAGIEAGSETRWEIDKLRAYFEQQDSLALAGNVRCPVLLIHARADEHVSIEHTLAIARYLRTDTTLVALEGGNHTSAQHDPEIGRSTVAWLLGMGGNMERSTGFEPATFGLGSRRSTS